MHVSVAIENFKSIERVSLKLGKVTALIGPPNSGKSNFLEALSAFGYAVKVAVERKLGWHDERSLGVLSDYIRMTSCVELTHRLRGGAARVRGGRCDVGGRVRSSRPAKGRAPLLAAQSMRC
ncbi:MAG: AAA family ATPase [Crenarchaeota archaeon]|nr:AAA family ATPase [Thermoproteota archaeon]